MSIGVRKQLDLDLEAMPKQVRASTLAEVARALADALDDEPGARDAASVAKELRATMTELYSRANQVPSEVDPVDRITDSGQSATVVPIGSRRSG